MKLLIVDDDRSLCDALSDVLVDAGYEVECAHSADAACGLLQGADYDLVISDWTMPGSGGTVVAFVRQVVRQRRRDLPVVVLSSELPARSLAEDMLPVVAQLEKPVAASVLLRVIRQALVCRDRSVEA